MKITMRYDQRQQFQCENGAGVFDDIERAVNHLLRKFHHLNAKVTVRNFPGKLVMSVSGSDLETVKPYIDAFLERMKKDGFRVLITYVV